MAAAAGDAQYPWESRAHDGVIELFRRSKLRDLVLSCLARDPAARPTAVQLRTRIDSIGQATATHAIAATPPDVDAAARVEEGPVSFVPPPPQRATTGTCSVVDSGASPHDSDRDGDRGGRGDVDGTGHGLPGHLPQAGGNTAPT